MRAFGWLLVVAALALCACGAMADKRYDYPAWGFSVVFPTPPKVEEEQATPDHVHNFEAKVDHGDGEIRSVTVLDAAPDETLESVGKEQSARIATSIQGDAALATVVRTPDGVVGREIRFSSNGRPIFTLRYFLVGRRLYQVTAGAIDGFDDPFVTSFLDSFRITSGVAGAAPARGA